MALKKVSKSEEKRLIKLAKKIDKMRGRDCCVLPVSIFKRSFELSRSEEEKNIKEK